MSLKKQALKNVSSTWFGLGVNILVGFLLSPYILHKLGDDAFGLWILVVSFTGFYGLFDLGIRSSIIKYVAHYHAAHDEDGIARVICTSLTGYGGVALVLLFATFLSSFYVGRLFHVSGGFLRTARVLFLMVGAAVAMGFPLGVFGGVLQGLQKFTWVNLTQAAATLVRALLIVIALRHGRGLLAVALITMGLPLLASIFYIGVVHRFVPIRLGRRFVSRSSFRQLMGYGSITFIIIVAEQLRFQTDAVIIGVFLSASAITFFSIGAKLCDYAVMPVHSMADIFLPMSSEAEASNNRDRLRQIFIEGNRFCAFTMFPICVVMIILGRSLIQVWVGPKYVSSYMVLLLLIVPKSLYRAQAASTRLLFGIFRHRVLAVATILEGVINLGLSIALVRPFGIIGDTLGTTIPLLATSLLFLPLYLCHLLEVPLRTFLTRAYLLPLALCAPLAAALLLMQHWFWARTYSGLLVQVLVGGLVYGVGLLWFFVTQEPMGVRLRREFTTRVSRAF
ncbi:MAG: oligosaccharide flippase family protein [Terriglobia bacterium]